MMQISTKTEITAIFVKSSVIVIGRELWKILMILILKPLSYHFQETIGFDVKALFVSRPVLRVARRYKKNR